MSTASPLRSSLDPLAASLGLIFTDSRGRIVFGDSHFLDLIGPDKAVMLVGQPLHKVIGTDQETITGLISEIGRTGYVRDQRLVLLNRNGSQTVVACSGIATYDDQGSFIGVDLTLRDPEHTALPATLLDTHSDVLDARIKQIEFEVRDHAAEQSEALSNLYFVAQVSAIQILLGRLGGPRVVEAVETMINQSAAKNHWPVQIKGGRFVIQTAKTPLEAYQRLLAELFEYAGAVAGQPTIIEEMKLVDAHMKPEARTVAGELGLRDYLG